MKFIFDKNLTTERELPVSSFGEHIIDNRISGNYSITVTSTSELPDLSEFANNRSFTTIEARNDSGTEIPIVGDYNNIADLVVNYFNDGIQYQLSVTINKVTNS